MFSSNPFTTKNLSSKRSVSKVWLSITSLVIFSLLLTACGSAPTPKTYTIGMLREGPFLDSIFDGFKAAMTDLGYVEGKNIKYVYHAPTGNDAAKAENEVKSLLNEKVDLLLTMGNASTRATKKMIEGSNTPVVFVPFVNPVEAGIVASIAHPGGNLTGIQAIDNGPQVLEWLLKIAPNTKQIYAPYSPKDAVALTTVKSLPDVAKQLGVKLILDPVTSKEQEIAAIKALPKDAAIFFVPSPTLNPSSAEMKKLALELGIPSGMRDPDPTDVVFTHTTDATALGKQAAILVDKIFKGAKPSDLPVETPDFILIINLKTAKAIGLNIPDEILQQAKQVIR